MENKDVKFLECDYLSYVTVRYKWILPDDLAKMLGLVDHYT